VGAIPSRQGRGTELFLKFNNTMRRADLYALITASARLVINYRKIPLSIPFYGIRGTDFITFSTMDTAIITPFPSRNVPSYFITAG